MGALSQFGYTVPNQQSFLYPNGLKLIGIYNSGSFSERYSTIQLNTRVPLFQVLIDNPKPGDIIFAVGECEVTTERNTNTEVVKKLTWCTGSGDINGIEISEENGENVDLNRHHMTLNSVGTFQVPSDTPPGALRYVTWVIGCFNGNIQPQYIDVNQDYGRLIVQHYRPI